MHIVLSFNLWYLRNTVQHTGTCPLNVQNTADTHTLINLSPNKKKHWKHSKYHKDIIIIWSNNIYKHYAWLVWCIPHFERYTNSKLLASLSTDLPISSAVLYSRFSPRLMSITFTPRLASSLAYAFPIPSLLPVTTGKWLNTLHLQWLI